MTKSPERFLRKIRWTPLVVGLFVVAIVVTVIEIDRVRYVEIFTGQGKTKYRLFGMTIWSKDGSRWFEPMPGTVQPLMSETWIYAGSSGRTLFGQGVIRCTDNGKIPMAHGALQETLALWNVEPHDIARARFIMAMYTTHVGPLWMDADYDNEVLWAEPASGEPGDNRIQLWPIDEQGEFAQLLRSHPYVEYVPDYP